ncbi:MAG: hypothetical protein PVF27_05310 [Gemmatimonadales bacterium]|jgi:hypothetical protein
MHSGRRRWHHRGTTDNSIVFIILAVLAAVALPQVWDRLPALVRWGAVGMIALLVVVGLVSMTVPKGLGANAMRLEERAQREAERAGRRDSEDAGPEP